MKPGSFDLFTPATLEEALDLLSEHEDDGKVLAGGQSLVPAMNFRLATPTAVVDLNGIPGNDRVRVDDNELAIEMLARHLAFERPVVVDALGILLARTSRLVGHLPIRVRGTFAGSIAHADPAAEWCALALALDATIVARSTRGERRLPAAEFFEGPFTTALSPDEIITEVRLPLLGGVGTAVREKSQTAGDFATVATLVVLRVEGGAISEARVGLAGVEAQPVRCKEAEEAMVGAPVTRDILETGARVAAEHVDPISDVTCSADYRRHLVRVLVGRALEQAAREAS